MTLLLPDVPAAWVVAAERVRRHLVAARGGAPFLSPTDADLLVGWLESGVPVPTILGAIEAAADRRRRQRCRLPLALEHARKELRALRARPLAPVVADAAPGWSPLEAVATAGLDAAPAPARAPLDALASALRSLPVDDPDRLLDEATALVTAALEEVWAALGDGGRRPLLDRARADLADLADLLDEGALDAVVEEHARGLLREELPMLSATSILRAVAP